MFTHVAIPNWARSTRSYFGRGDHERSNSPRAVDRHRRRVANCSQARLRRVRRRRTPRPVPYPNDTPWTVWATKTGHPLAPVIEETPEMRLGTDLEPWLLDQAARILTGATTQPALGIGRAFRTNARLYVHPEYSWRFCSPDGHLYTTSDTYELVECKTSGLISGWAARGWGDTTVPLGIEFQARWQMHVMNAEVCHIVALVAGRGLCHYPIVRDLYIEADLVEQVDEWWQRHIIGGDEPPLTGRDANIVAALYPKPVRRSVILDDTDALQHWQAYRDAHLDETEAGQRKTEAGVALKALLGDAEVGLVEGRPVATWAARKGRVNWEQLARDFADGEGLPLPDPDAWRSAPTRAFTIKE